LAVWFSKSSRNLPGPGTVIHIDHLRFCSGILLGNFAWDVI